MHAWTTPCPRAALVRQRPGYTESCPPLQDPGISRRHLLLTPHADGLVFESLGRCAVLCNGREAIRGVLREGDVLSIENHLVLLCTRRPAATLPSRHPGERQPPRFGAADGDGLVGESPAAWALRDEIAFAAAAPGHVLVVGESGTGKELVARAIHRLSPRGRSPLIARSAASFPDTLIDAELFGNMRDYPNPGMALRQGLIGAADGSSLFLDEIGELPRALQGHLLRVLDAGGEYHRLGEAAPRRADFRLIAATNRPLDELKEDFVARFSLRVRVPSLGERREDIPLLVNHLLDRTRAQSPALCAPFLGAASGGERFYRLEPGFIEELVRRPYVLHVRELGEVLVASLRASGGRTLLRPAAQGPRPASVTIADVPAARRSKPTAEELRAALARHDGNQSRAWAELGLTSRYALRRLLRKTDHRDPT